MSKGPDTRITKWLTKIEKEKPKMDETLDGRVTNLGRWIKNIDIKASELENLIAKNENTVVTDLSYTKDCLRDMDKKFAELQQDHEKLGDRVNKAMLYICGVFAGMHYPAAAEGLKEICGFEKKE